MTVSIFSRRKIKGKIQDVTLDATISESHEYNNEITDYPVEDGFNIQDHVQRLPEKLIMEGVVSLTPLEGNNTTISRDDDSDRVQNAYNKLLEYGGYTPPKQSGTEPTIQPDPIPLDIVTGMKTWTNMYITRATFPFNRDTGQSLRFTVEFKKVRKVAPELTFVPKVSELNGKAPGINDRAAKTADSGKQSTREGAFNSELNRSGTITVIRGGATQ
jgi:hypothetical protein